MCLSISLSWFEKEKSHNAIGNPSQYVRTQTCSRSSCAVARQGRLQTFWSIACDGLSLAGGGIDRKRPCRSLPVRDRGQRLRLHRIAASSLANITPRRLWWGVLLGRVTRPGFVGQEKRAGHPAPKSVVVGFDYRGEPVPLP